MSKLKILKLLASNRIRATPSTPAGPAVMYTYINYGVDGIGVFAVDSNYTFTEIGTITGLGTVVYLYIYGKYMYVVTTTNVKILDISNPASVNILATITPTGTPTKVIRFGRYLLLSTTSGIYFYTVTNPASPTLSSSYTTDGGFIDFVISTTYIYGISSSGVTKIFYLALNSASGSITSSAYMWESGVNFQRLAYTGKYIVAVGSNASNNSVTKFFIGNSTPITGNVVVWPSVVHWFEVCGLIAYQQTGINLLRISDDTTMTTMYNNRAVLSYSVRGMCKNKILYVPTPTGLEVLNGNNDLSNLKTLTIANKSVKGIAGVDLNASHWCLLLGTNSGLTSVKITNTAIYVFNNNLNLMFYILHNGTVVTSKTLTSFYMDNVDNYGMFTQDLNKDYLTLGTRYFTSSNLQNYTNKVVTASQLLGDFSGTDSYGNVYICGRSNASTYAKIFITKYNSSGMLLWKQMYNSTYSIYPKSFCVTPNGCTGVFLKADSNASGSTTPKYGAFFTDASGYTNGATGITRSGFDTQIHGLMPLAVVQQDGRQLISLKLSDSSNNIDIRFWADSGYNVDYNISSGPIGLAVIGSTSDGYVYVSYRFNASSSCVAKYYFDGLRTNTLIWVRIFQIPGEEYIYNISADVLGDYIVLAIAPGSKTYIVKYPTSGELLGPIGDVYVTAGDNNTYRPETTGEPSMSYTSIPITTVAIASALTYTQTNGTDALYTGTSTTTELIPA